MKPQLINPNDPVNASKVDIAQLKISLRNAYETLSARVAKKQITEEESKRRLKAFANDIVDHLDMNKLPSDSLSEYGEIFRTAGRWELSAAAFYETIKAAREPESTVYATLRYAEALAHLGKVDEAIKFSRQTFTAPASAKQGILLAVLYEIVPACQGKGKDMELAGLLRDAVLQHDIATVDEKSVEGRAFLMGKRHHMVNALKLSDQLETGSGTKV
ncbi:MAG: tetratricopeptide repeat protein [Armatimonadetes bacterium]|nr:tetratricopeptide repeat protein [Armatimonadota bacterium]